MNEEQTIYYKKDDGYSFPQHYHRQGTFFAVIREYWHFSQIFETGIVIFTTRVNRHWTSLICKSTFIQTSIFNLIILCAQLRIKMNNALVAEKSDERKKSRVLSGKRLCRTKHHSKVAQAEQKTDSFVKWAASAWRTIRQWVLSSHTQMSNMNVRHNASIHKSAIYVRQNSATSAHQCRPATNVCYVNKHRHSAQWPGCMQLICLPLNTHTSSCRNLFIRRNARGAICSGVFGV